MRTCLTGVVPFAALVTVAALAATAQESHQKESTSDTTPFGIITSFAGDGSTGYYGDNGPASESQLAFPIAVAVDSSGNVYVVDTDNNRIRKVDASTGIISTIAGSSEAGYSGDGGPAANALLHCPEGIAIDKYDNVFISDTCNQVVRKIDASTKIITTVAGHPYMTEYDRTCRYGGDGGPAAKAELCFPTALAVDSAENLYVADTSNSLVRRVTSNGEISTFAGTQSAGLLGVAANGMPATDVLMSAPGGLAVDADRNLYIANTGYCLIEKVNVNTGILTVYAGLVSPPSGNPCSPTREGVPATSTSMGSVHGLAFDSAGNLFFADILNNLARRIDAKTSLVTTVAGDFTPYDFYPYIGDEYGISGYTGDHGAATVAELASPFGVAVDQSENLYIADSANDAIRKVTQTLTKTAPAPAISPDGAGTGYGFGSDLKVKISDANSGARIYYTTDGTTPATASKLYAGPFTISGTTSVIAFATATNVANSYAAQGNYFQVGKPVISPNGGKFTKPVYVTISLPDYGTVYYTTDGTDPCTSKTASYYYSPFRISQALALRAVTIVGAGCGPEASAAFLVPVAPAVTTGPATKVTAATATLTGTVYSGGLATQYWFIYEPNCDGTNLKSAVKTLPAGVATESVSIGITGLKINTSYCFGVFASNSVLEVQGGVEHFTTTN